MLALFCLALSFLVLPFKSNGRLEAENVALRHQVIVLRRQVRGRVHLTSLDRLLLVRLYHWFPSILRVLSVVKPETPVRWHRVGIRCYWRWKSRPGGGRPPISAELRALIRRMSIENPLWGAPRIHGELLKLGFEVARSSVARYMAKRRGPPSQSWGTVLRNHAPEIAAMDLFVVPTLGFDLLYAFVIVRLDRRELVWINTTGSPTAEWIARQVTEAFAWDTAPRYLRWQADLEPERRAPSWNGVRLCLSRQRNRNIVRTNHQPTSATKSATCVTIAPHKKCYLISANSTHIHSTRVPVKELSALRCCLAGRL